MGASRPSWASWHGRDRSTIISKVDLLNNIPFPKKAKPGIQLSAHPAAPCPAMASTIHPSCRAGPRTRIGSRKTSPCLRDFFLDLYSIQTMAYAVWTAGVLSMDKWLMMLGVDDDSWRFAPSDHMCHCIRMPFLSFSTPSM
jgi:hypothetical protein